MRKLLIMLALNRLVFLGVNVDVARFSLSDWPPSRERLGFDNFVHFLRKQCWATLDPERACQKKLQEAFSSLNNPHSDPRPILFFFDIRDFLEIRESLLSRADLRVPLFILISLLLRNCSIVLKSFS